MEDYVCGNDNVTRLKYIDLAHPHLAGESLKNSIVTVIWNDERLLRADIEDIANNLLKELREMK